MNLSTLLQAYFPTQAHSDAEIISLAENSSRADEKTLFFCIAGANADGHNYAEDAYRRGCRHFVAEKPLALPTDARIFYCDNTRRALAHIAAAFYGHPSHQMRLVGITGTKGKTTTALLLAHILNRTGIPCGYIGTNGVQYGEICQKTANTTPDPITLQKHLRDMLAAGIQTAVIEISSQALMQYRADGTCFESVVFTNLTSDHIGIHEHPDFEHYRACKRRLFHEFGAKSIVCNLDDPATPDMTCGSDAEIHTCSLEDVSADFCAKDLRIFKDSEAYGIEFALFHAQDHALCRLPLMGSFNASNALLAAAVARTSFSVSLARITAALADAAIEGRSEIVRLPNGAVAVIDYAHNGESLSRLLSSLREYTDRRLIVLFGSVGERTQLRRAELGTAAASYADLAILTSDNPGKESPDAIIQDIAKAFEGSKTPYLAIPDRAEAIRAALKETQNGDLLVLAGKGHETYQLVGSQKLPFSEKELLVY
ncbi:MAG: UDP-N-acetylmuramoyl-L-alanyl-D-glutamate--2,6-diaminopimelate ligase [Clostridia bacterium]|nr:UDP-N-acetylmuramoyl-L-alanyl-D-glutamate--2,6-diaminopimelate ligase [Clostridia bacterium]